ncbi:hypothetical protein VTL71DRAFT_16402 [Oculimacula yallundae]|uniref:Uncharacterized protein n=1 Tax=Oculimacula yallundae TaxID=86028 RepID=A0ABR4CEC4_9HELO
MALRLGVGDIFTLCKSAVDVCSRAIHEEHEGTSTLVAEMKQIRTHLKTLETQIGDERAFVKARPELAPVINRSLEPLHRDLSDLRATLHACSGPRKPSIHVVDQVRHLVLYKAKLEGFQEKLPIHRASITAIQDLIDSQTLNERRESMVKLDGILAEQERGRTRTDDYEKRQSVVMKLFEESMGKRSISSDVRLDTGQLLESLEDDLMEEGLERIDAERALFPITKALLRQPFPSTVQNRSSLPPLGFKLDLFEMRRESEISSRNEIDTTEFGTQNDKALAPDEAFDDSTD